MSKKGHAFLSFCAVAAWVATAQAETVPTAGDEPWWLWTFLGRLHPLVVHFPIALLLCAAGAEGLARLAPRARWASTLAGAGSSEPSPRGPGDVVLFCLVVGAAGAGLAAALGWIHAGSQSFSGRSLELLDWHRAAGIATFVFASATAALAIALRRRPSAGLERLFLAGLVASALGVATSGYFGGSLVYGDDYLTSALPGARPAAIELGDVPTFRGRVNFVRDVQPIFESACVECHGPDEQKGRLRLDARHLAIAGGRSGRAIVPGEAANSELLARILGEGTERRMPVDADPLAPEEIAAIHAWIEQGAHWPSSASVGDATLAPHWAYTAPVRPELPEVRAKDWVRNPIDAFVLARLEAEELAPSPEADRETLVRRLSFDLTGLPPRLEEVDAFLADTEPGAYERLVDRLLASPHYGEKWARHWLDLARYADSEGHDQDHAREIWRYRDWVVQAFNDDLPFDRFTVEQIAGDLVPDATPSSRIATGFHRNTMFNREAGVDQEEAHWEVLVDRVGTTGSVWLGSSLACAQCHDHKHDPFSQADFYAFLAFFNNADLHRKATHLPNLPPVHHLQEAVLELPTPKQAEQQKKLRARLAALRTGLQTRASVFEPERRDWEASVRAAIAGWRPLAPDGLASSGGSTLEALEDHSVRVGGTNPGSDTYRVSGHAGSEPITGVRLEVLTDDDLPGRGPGRFHDGGFVLTGFRGTLDGGEGPVQELAFSEARADESRPFHSVERLLPSADPGPALAASGWSARPGADHRVVLATDPAVTPSEDGVLAFELEHGRSVIGRLGIGRFRISVTSAPNPFETIDLPSDVLAAVLRPRAERTPGEDAAVVAYFRGVAPHLEPLREQIARAEARLEALDVASTLVMKEAATKVPLTAVIREGGSYASPGESVEAGVPAVLHPLHEGDEPRDRLALAHWLVDGDNPLVARVMVNRYWEQVFGRGLVETTEDFGSLGAEPSHPELLDWLALEFVGQEWSVKALHRLMVTSATYRQSSRVTPELQERDPQNLLLARTSRGRLPAEHVRDAALAASGLLNRKVGGPPVFPHQPERSDAILYAAAQWKNSRGADRYRRSLYTFWRRTNLHPLLAAFDAPSREVSTGRRMHTNTPMQALALLNARDAIDAARVLGHRLARLDAEDDRARAAHGFRRVLTRRPEPEELDRVTAFYRAELEHFERRPGAAAELLQGEAHASNGNGNGHGSADPDAPRLAAWTMLASALFNLDEAITRP